jgi:hypothetical protein
MEIDNHVVKEVCWSLSVTSIGYVFYGTFFAVV